MIVLDTNIISEMMKTSPSLQVMTWIDEQTVSELFITTITIAEIVYGLHALPAGHRRNQLEDAFHNTISSAFEYRVLGFDELSAHRYGQLMADRKKLGRPLAILDGQIAAIAYINKFKIATRNMADFYECGLGLINPFEHDVHPSKN